MLPAERFILGTEKTSSAPRVMPKSSCCCCLCAASASRQVGCTFGSACWDPSLWSPFPEFALETLVADEVDEDWLCLKDGGTALMVGGSDATKGLSGTIVRGTGGIRQRALSLRLLNAGLWR
jgi:hypothetical protein